MDEAARKRLWQDYNRLRSQELREQIIIEYAPLVKLVAGRLSMYLGYNVEYDDLVGYGVFGLIDAIDKFDTCKDVKFETYASLRIRGAILDQIRKMDWIPRTIRQRQKKIDSVIREIETTTGKTATDEEITGVVSLNEYIEQGGPELAGDKVGASGFEVPEDVAQQVELKEQLKDALDSLTEKERKVVVLYYYEDLTLKEISRILEVSESRVSQLHTKALMKMKVKLGDYMGILTDR